MNLARPLCFLCGKRAANSAAYASGLQTPTCLVLVHAAPDRTSGIPPTQHRSRVLVALEPGRRPWILSEVLRSFTRYEKGKLHVRLLVNCLESPVGLQKTVVLRPLARRCAQTTSAVFGGIVCSPCPADSE